MKKQEVLSMDEMILFCLNAVYDMTFGTIRALQRDGKLLGSDMVNANKAMVSMHTTKSNPEEMLGKNATRDFADRVKQYIMESKLNGNEMDICAAACIVNRAPCRLMSEAFSATMYLPQNLTHIYGDLLWAIYDYKNGDTEQCKHLGQMNIAAIYNRMKLESTKSFAKREIMKMQMRLKKQVVYQGRQK